MDVKLFVADPEAVRWEEYTPLFTRWLQSEPGEWMDIADYLHVPSGPGILLISKAGHLSMDNRRNQPGLVYGQREPLEGDNRERLVALFETICRFADRIEGEKPELRFRRDALEFAVNDRVNFPNDTETFQALATDLTAAVQQAFGAESVGLEHDADPRERLTIHVKIG